MNASFKSIMADSIQNVPMNLVVPVDFRKQSLLSGTVTSIALETIVSRMLRQLTGIQKRGWMELATIHAIAQPFLGGLNYFNNKERASSSPSFMTALQDGAKDTPAVLVAAYIAQVGQSGFTIPRIGVQDTIMVLVAKAVTRAIQIQVAGQVDFINKGMQAHDALVEDQKSKSRLV